VSRFGIVGGGLLGMTLGWNLAKAGHRVTIFEGAPRLGGLAEPWTLGDVVWDRHYHVTLASDLALIALLRELGLESELRWARPGTGFFVNGSLYPFSEGIDYLKFPALSPFEKVRLGATILRASRVKDWRPLEHLTAVEWLTRLSGRATVEKIWLPLLRAKLGPHANRASAAFIWAIIARMFAARGSGPHREQFGYVQGGYARTLAHFQERLRGLGVEIRTGARIERVETAAGSVRIVTPSDAHRFDRAVVTVAAPMAARLVPDLTAAERALCAGVEYQGIICASMLASSRLAPYYITNIADASVPFTAVIEMTAIVDRRELKGQHLIYLPKYVASDDPAFLMNDATVEETFLAALQRIHPRFDRASIRAFRVSRVPYVFPIPTLEYSKRLPPVRTSLPGVFLASSAQIVNGTLNVNETVKLANGLTAELLADVAGEKIAATA
jgi:protoporphyrinogen oxidase